MKEYAVDLSTMQELYRTNFISIKKKKNELYLQKFQNDIQKIGGDDFFSESFAEMIQLKNFITEDKNSWTFILSLVDENIDPLICRINQYALLLQWMKKSDINFVPMKNTNESTSLVDLAHDKFINYIFPWIEKEYAKYKVSYALENYKASFPGSIFDIFYYKTLKQELCDPEASKKYTDISSLLAYVKTMNDDLSAIYIESNFNDIYTWAYEKKLLTKSDIKGLNLVDKDRNAILQMIFDCMRNTVLRDYESLKYDPYINETLLKSKMYDIGKISWNTSYQDIQQIFDTIVEHYIYFLHKNLYFKCLLENNIISVNNLRERKRSYRDNFYCIIKKLTCDLLSDIPAEQKKNLSVLNQQGQDIASKIDRYYNNNVDIDDIPTLDCFENICDIYLKSKNLTKIKRFSGKDEIDKEKKRQKIDDDKIKRDSILNHTLVSKTLINKKDDTSLISKQKFVITFFIICICYQINNKYCFNV
jgi:hypothetical protein